MNRVPNSPYLTNRALRASVRFLRSIRTERGDLIDHAAWQLDQLRRNAVKNGTLHVGRAARKPRPDERELQHRIARWFARGKSQRSPASADVE